MTSDGHPDDGFTLVELLISVAVMTVILSSLTLALLTFLSNGQTALARDDHSAGSALLASYLDRDVASAEAAVAGSALCSGSTNALLLTWQEFTASSSAPSPAPTGEEFRAAYRITTASAGTHLERVLCRGTTVLDRTMLVTSLPSASAVAVTVTSPAGCEAQLVSLTLAAHSGDDAAPYAFRSCVSTRTPS